jgi:hypothetical protein
MMEFYDTMDYNRPKRLTEKEAFELLLLRRGSYVHSRNSESGIWYRAHIEYGMEYPAASESLEENLKNAGVVLAEEGGN